MIEVFAFIIVIIMAWLLIKHINKPATIEEARNRGIEKVKPYIKNPILAEDYAQANGVSKAELDSLISQGKMSAYNWHQYTYVENDADTK